jgi:riboflavin kinase/FMN adenylyltransferase
MVNPPFLGLARTRPMNVVHTISELSSADLDHGSCVTIGNFDGVHLGHQALLHRTKERARELGLTSIVVTFDPHPLRVIRGQTPPFITLIEQKMRLLSAIGLDHTVCLPFTREMAQLSPEEFVQLYLVQGLKTKALIIGHDYVFGKNKRGNYQLLKDLGQRHGFVVEKIDPIYKNGDVVSSTRIRNLVQAGHVEQVRPLLGRFYQVSGSVITGHKRGGPILGIPTANLKLVDELFPQPGVYAVWAEWKEEILPAVANVGHNPTFGHNALSVEVHILDFGRDLYGEHLRINFVQRIRSEQKFSGIEELKTQIHQDIAQARKLLSDPETFIYTCKA